MSQIPMAIRLWWNVDFNLGLLSTMIAETFPMMPRKQNMGMAKSFKIWFVIINNGSSEHPVLLSMHSLDMMRQEDRLIWTSHTYSRGSVEVESFSELCQKGNETDSNNHITESLVLLMFP